MKKSIFITAVLAFCAIKTVSAQQTPVFTEYNYNPFIINSAYTGTTEGIEATLSNSGFGTNQIEGTPQNLAFTFNMPFRNEKIGLGGGIINDEIGVTSATQIFGAYSYKIYFNENAHPYWKIYDRTILSFGVTAGALLYNEDLLRLGIQDDPNFMENVNTTLPTMGLGALFGHGNFFAGISAPNVLGDALGNQDNLNLTFPLYGYIGYHFFTNKFQEYVLKPSMLFKYEEGAPFQVDTNLSLSYKNMFEVGAGYRTSSSLNVLVGFYLFKNFRALYNYTQASTDIPIGNTHGIVLSYRGGKGYAL